MSRIKSEFGRSYINLVFETIAKQENPKKEKNQGLLGLFL